MDLSFDSLRRHFSTRKIIFSGGLFLVFFFITPSFASATAGQQVYTTPGTYSWTVPAGVTSVSVVSVGAGGGGIWNTSGIGPGGGAGGDLRYYNAISVTPGETLTVVVGSGGTEGNTSATSGGPSSIARSGTVLLMAAGGGAGQSFNTPSAQNGPSTTIGGSVGGGTGGRAASAATNANATGGGGAGGYAGNGGAAGTGAVAGSAGSGGGGGGGGGATSYNAGSGGGVGLLGQGSDGTAGSAYGASAVGGGGGSGGASGTMGSTNVAGVYGGGGGAAMFNAAMYAANGATGAVRIIWGPSRSFPSTNTGDMYDVTWNSATGGTSSGVSACTLGDTVVPTCTPSTGYSTASCSSFTCSTSNSFTPSFSLTAYSVTQTTDTDFNAGTQSSTVVTGSGNGGSVVLGTYAIAAQGQQAYTTAGTYSWTAPAGVTSVSVVMVGAGMYGGNGYGAGGGALGYKNNITVVPGTAYTVIVPGNGTATPASIVINGTTYSVASASVSSNAGGTTHVNCDGGGNGGNGAASGSGVGAGGAGGYSGDGGYGSITGVASGAGSGGGASGGSGTSGGGGGVGLLGEGSSGTSVTTSGGIGGSGGVNGGRSGGLYGGGGSVYFGGYPGAGGAVRIIWGPSRSFPSTNTVDMTTVASGTGYSMPGTFTSSVMDIGAGLKTTTLNYSTSLNSQTITIDVRAGNTATPDGTWSAWQTGIADGGSLAALASYRYVQYRANLSTSNTGVTPTLDSATINTDNNSYTVTFDTNGGDGGSTGAQSLVYNAPTTLTTNGFTKTGYTFIGWNTAANGSGTAYRNGDKYTIGAGGVTLYAQWTLPFVSCGSSVTFTYNGSQVTYGTVTGADGKCWMDRNLGATEVATSSTDTASYGHLFQWGRSPDGHQVRTSGTTATLADIPGNNLFITASASPYDWRVTPSDTLWANSSSTNNPCPTDWYVPTRTEWATVASFFSPQTSVGAFNSALKLPLAGYRVYYSPTQFYDQGSYGEYWSSSPASSNAYFISFGSGSVNPASNNYLRASGYSVRCVKDTYSLTIPASGGNGSGSYGGTAAGPITPGTAVSITATPAASSNFTSWTATGAASACNGSAVSPCAFTMTGAALVTANYTLKTYTLTYTAGTGGTLSTSIATNTGASSPGTMADSNEGSIGTIAWNNPNNAKTNDAVYAVSATGVAYSTDGSAAIIDSAVRIVKSDGSIGTTNNKDSVSVWHTTKEYVSYGSSSNLWGETWTTSDINNSNFGVVVAAKDASYTTTTHYLKATNFGFSIPSGATINGILVEIEKLFAYSASVLQGSYVQTPYGDKKIEDIKTGDKVYSFNEKTNKTEEDTVTGTQDHGQELRPIYSIYVDGLEEPMKVTGNHRIYTKDGYKIAEEIKVGDVLMNSQLENRTVSKIEIESQDSRVYDLEIENNHNFFVNTLLVHNSAGGSYYWPKVDHIRITVSYTSSSSGSSISQTVNYGASGSAVTAVPDTGYSFVNWSDAVATAARTDTNITANNSVTANFSANSYNVTFDTNGGDGGATAPQSLSYNTPTALTTNGFTKTGYSFVNWNTAADGSGTAYADGASYTIGTAGVTLYAQWLLSGYALTIPASSGTGSGSYGGTGAGTITANAAVSITATPAASSNFTSWTATGAAAACNGSAVSPCAFTMTGVASVTANYTLKTYTLTYTAGANGTLTGTVSQVVNYGASGSAVTAVPNTGYTFSSWSDAVAWSCGSTVTGLDGLTYGTVLGADGNCWMDRNLGATRAAVSSTDYLAYGSLFQWGRMADGHQLITRTSSTAGTAVNGSTATNADIPGNNLFITESSSPYDWRATPSDTLWANSASANNSCPASWHVPTKAEWDALITTAGITNAATAYSSTLKLPISGYRDRGNAALNSQGSVGYYWSGSISGTDAYSQLFYSTIVSIADNRAFGFSVRCVKDSGVSTVRTDTNITANNSVTANFSANSYTVTFNTNGGDGGSTAAESLVYNAPTALTTNGFTRTGYSFTGWNTAANGSGTNYANGASYTIGAAGVTLYAQWSINSYTLTIPASGGTVSYLVVAGGGGGGASNGGGGGAGGYLTGTLSVIAQGYTVTVGDKGIGAVAYPGSGQAGGSSVFGSISTVGGGAGRGEIQALPAVGGSGGGGAGYDTANTGPAAGTAGQGNTGGNGSRGSAKYAGGGGGGAGTVGVDGATGTPVKAGDGGAGLQSSISGVATWYAGGGGGGGYPSSDTTGAGGSGVGGAGSMTTVGSAATANTGSGGGGGMNGSGGGAGGTGIVIISYPTASMTATCGNATVTTSGANTICSYTTVGSSTFTVNSQSGSGGSYGGTAAGSVNYGTSVSITATPAASSNFTSWTATGAAATACNGSAISPCAFTMTGVASVTANYTLKTYTLTVTTGANGSASGPSGTYNYGQVVTLTATPNVNYYLTSWTGDADCSDGSVTMTANVSCTANFSSTTYQDPATGASVSSLASNQATLSWTTPPSLGSTIMIVRSLSPITTSPVYGTAYTAGSNIDAGTSVVYSGVASTFVDSGLTGGFSYYYKIFAKNPFNGYSTGVSPTGSPVTVSGSAPTINQIGYLWRNDDSSGSSAVSQNTALSSGVYVGDRRRLRFQITNESAYAANGYNYRLEYSVASPSCTVWNPVPVLGNFTNQPWIMDVSPYTSNGFSTSHYSGLTTQAGSFASGLFNSLSNETTMISLPANSYSELEYSLKSTSNSVLGSTYCFRLTNGGSTNSFTYSSIPQIILQGVTAKPVYGGSSIIEVQSAPNNAVGGGGGGGGSGSGGGGGAPSAPSAPIEAPAPPAPPVQGGTPSGSGGSGGGDVGILYNGTNGLAAVGSVVVQGIFGLIKDVFSGLMHFSQV